METTYIDPIYISAQNVFLNMFSLNLKKGILRNVEEIVSDNRVNASIGITGDLKGTIVFSFPEKTAFTIVEEMAGMKVEEFDKFVASAVGELANIISGNAMSYFSNDGYKCDIIPPQVSHGTNKTFSSASKKILSIPMLAGEKSFDLYVSISK